MQIQKVALIRALPVVLALVMQAWTNPGKVCGGPLPEEGIIIDGSYSIEALVQDIFVRKGCKNISNIKSIGQQAGIGYFENGSGSIGLEKGIIFSTGDINNALGPNNETETSSEFGDDRGDRDLNQLINGRIGDAVGFEFDFVPLDSVVTFRYVFASEEYCEYVGTKFNDVFGFFISGPGISGPFSRNGANVALIPGTDRFVSINNINHVNNSEYYVDNTLSEDARNCGIPYNGGASQSEIEFDGFTKVLTATLHLIPCETYHLRLVVGDVSDQLYDSAVFLEAESFNIGGSVTVSAEASLDPTTVFEGCPNGQFVFQRVNTEDVAEALEVNFELAGTGTAIEGVDFEPLPRSVIIPAGRLSAVLPVNVVNDNVKESLETIVLELEYPCDCVTGDATMTIADPPEFQVDIPEAEVCPGGEARLAPVISEGVAPFSFLWETAGRDSILRVSPEASTTYALTVTDACGQQVIQRGRVNIMEPARAEISGIEKICPDNEGHLQVNFSGEAPWNLSYAIDGEEAATISGIMDNPYSLSVRKEGSYSLVRFSDSRCEGIVAGSAVLEISQIAVEAEISGVSCTGTSDGRVNVAVSGGEFPYRYLWDQGMGERKNLQNIPAGLYNLTVTDALGCEASRQVRVPSPAPLEEVSFDCLDLGLDSIAFHTGGGTPPYQFSVDGSNYSDHSLFQRLEEGRFYTLIIRDANGCRLEQDFIMPANTDKYVELAREVTAVLGEPFQISPQLLIPDFLVDHIQWSPSVDLTCSDCLEPTLDPQANRSYTIRVTDKFGCRDEATIIVNVNRQASVFIPTAFSPNNDGRNDHFVIFADPDQVRRIALFQVYNRWGSLLYEVRDVQPNDPAYGWDGRFRGQWQKPGVYLYMARIELVNGKVLMKNGDVSLIR